MARRVKRKGTDNVLRDLGFPDAGELAAKAILAKKLNEAITARHLSQVEAARLLGLPQPKISAIQHYKLRGISMERLMLALTAIGQRVEIVVRPTRNDASARIEVAL